MRLGSDHPVSGDWLYTRKKVPFASMNAPGDGNRVLAGPLQIQREHCCWFRWWGDHLPHHGRPLLQGVTSSARISAPDDAMLEAKEGAATFLAGPLFKMGVDESSWQHLSGLRPPPNELNDGCVHHSQQVIQECC